MADRSALLDALRDEAGRCRACPLWRNATQTVFGEGPPDPDIVFVGEQPGDREDREGHPFVGPAGLMFDKALAEAGIDRKRAYVTNAVKHFKFEPRGKLRLHKKPNASEIDVCKRWLLAEIDILKPRLLVALGATAAQSLVGKAVPVGRNRGAVVEIENARRAFITIHPSSLLRMPEPVDRQAAYVGFVAGLRKIGELAGKLPRLGAPAAA